MLSINNFVTLSIILIQISYKNIITSKIIRIILFTIIFYGEVLGDKSTIYIRVTLY